MEQPEKIEKYIEAHISQEPPWLDSLYRETWRTRLYPRMCSGHLQGSILTMLTSMIKPRRVLELGTFSGYSALAIAAGMPEDSELHTIEIDDEHIDEITRAFDSSPFAGRIHLHIGDALDIVPRLGCQTWDMIFIDANKRHYPQYYRMLKPLLSKGGYMLADNTLWDGKVAEVDKENADPQCLGILEFNDMVAADPEVEKTILPLRDGLTIIRKL